MWCFQWLCLAASLLWSTNAFVVPKQNTVTQLLVAINHRSAVRTQKVPGTLQAAVSEPSPLEKIRLPKLLLAGVPLQRTHEKVLYTMYLLAGLAVTQDSLPRHLGTSVLALVWLSFTLAISFMEAPVKFKAPLLRKYVAVDVGRHVFAAQHAVELGLASAFWIRQSPPQKAAVTVLVSTVSLFLTSFVVGPLLYLRAKYKMVHEAEVLTTQEKESLDRIADKIQGQKLPNAKWHLVYVLLDVIKVLGLGLFVRGHLLA